MQRELTPPRPSPRPRVVSSSFGDRMDPYYWMRDDARANPAVIAHLTAENAYTDAVTQPLNPLREQLYAELIGRIQPDDTSVPVYKNGYWYTTCYAQGREYPIYIRQKEALDSPVEVLLDANTAAVGHAFYDVAFLAISPDNTLLAWTEDTVGRRQYTVRVRNLTTGELLSDELTDVEADLVWANDNRTLLYIAKHPETLLGFRVMKHVIGCADTCDVLVYEQDDVSFYLGLSKSKSESHVFISAHSTVSSEYRYADANDPALVFHLAIPRERDHEYDLEEHGGKFIIRSNWRGKNFALYMSPIPLIKERATWLCLLAPRDDAYLASFDVFKNYIVISERSNALRHLRVLPLSSKESYLIKSDESAYTMSFGANEDGESNTLRYVYSSLTTPRTTYDYDLTTGGKVLRKQEAVLGGFDKSNYQTELVWAPALDGERIPVSIVRRKTTPLDGSAPLYQYGYGAYGLSQDPAFRSSILSLLDRGFIYAIAHVRGGQEMGRRWYDSGRLLYKRNTFTDFIAVTEYLIKAGYANASRVVAMGGSAGGLLIGAVANTAPHLYQALVAHVPFVDVVTTMLDETIPLTTNEYDEWGNPGSSAQMYQYMLSYSPYDAVSKQLYPAMLITAGLWDSQVQYWEPAKWALKLRECQQAHNQILLRINMDAGHGGKSGRFQHYHEVAEEYAFVLAAVGACT